MRTHSRLVAAAAVLGSGLIFAAPASAQQVCPYPGGNCPSPAPSPAGGGGGGSAGGGGTAVTDSSNPTALPFTGGEITLLALSGAAALGGGAVLLAAGRKRASD